MKLFFYIFPGEKSIIWRKKAMRGETSPSVCFGALLHKQPARKGLQAHQQSERKIQ